MEPFDSNKTKMWFLEDEAWWVGLEGYEQFDWANIMDKFKTVPNRKFEFFSAPPEQSKGNAYDLWRNPVAGETVTVTLSGKDYYNANTANLF